MDALDVIVVGGGVNGLACALVLARGGLTVRVIEDKPALGGGHRTEYPFPEAPKLAAHLGAHRLGFLPRDVVRLLGVKLPLRARDPSIFVPTATPGRYLLGGPGPEGLRAAVARVAPGDVGALEAMHAELDEIASDLAPAWVAGAMSLDATAERFVRAPRRAALVELCTGSVGAYLDRFGVASELVRAAIAADALTGTFGTWDTPGTGAALLVQHAARGAAGGGDAFPEGGMGALVRALAAAAEQAGVTMTTGKSAAQLVVEGNSVAGVALAGGEVVRATTVVCNADPLRLRAMVGDVLLPAEYARKIDGMTRGGSVTKVSLALSALPRFTCLPEERGQHGAVIQLLPGGDAPLAAMRAAFAAASVGRLPEAPVVECVIPTASDPSARDAEGRHHVSLLAPCSPYDLDGTSWAAEEERWRSRILAALEAHAPGASSLVVDAVVLTPKKIETHFGVSRGTKHHVDDAVIFGDRLPYATPIPGLYACGAGCAPAGGVFGAAGHNAAKRVLADLELGMERTEVGFKP